MKIREVIVEDTSAEEQLAAGSLVANLMPVLMFLRKRSEDRELSPKLRTDSLIQLVQNAGDTTFSYHDLVDQYENSDAVKEIVKSFNRDEIVLKSDSDTDDDEQAGEEQSKHTDPQKTVASMAKKARENRS